MMTASDALNGLLNLLQFVLPALLIAWADRQREVR